MLISFEGHSVISVKHLLQTAPLPRPPILFRDNVWSDTLRDANVQSGLEVAICQGPSVARGYNSFRSDWNEPTRPRWAKCNECEKILYDICVYTPIFSTPIKTNQSSTILYPCKMLECLIFTVWVVTILLYWKCRFVLVFTRQKAEILY